MAVAVLISFSPLLAAFLFYSCRRLAPLLGSRSDVTLSFSPTKLTRFEIGFVLLLFISRSFSHTLYSLWRRAICQGNPSELIGSDVDHEISLSMPLRTTHQDLADYVRAVQVESVDKLTWNNVQLSMILSAWAEPAMLLLLATRTCKIRPLGAVNVRNRLELLRPDLCKPEDLGRIDRAILSASYSKAVRRVKRGLEIDLFVSLNVPDGQGRLTTAFRQVFTMLQFTAPTSPGTSKSVEENPAWQRLVQGHFLMRHDDPSLWANVCKDYNPIHTSTIAARVFGFPGKLAHGNHVVAKAWVTLQEEKKGPDGVAFSTTLEPLWLEVSFKRPTIMPARLDALCGQTVSPNESHETINFQVVSKDKVRLAGSVGKLVRRRAD